MSPLFSGSCVNLVESLEKLRRRLREVRPHGLLRRAAGVGEDPGRVETVAAGAPAWREEDRGLGAQDRAERRPRRAARSPRPWRSAWPSKLVFDSVRERLGLDRARLCAVSAAPIARETLEFFLCLGMPILEVYGMSECTAPATLSLPTLPHSARPAVAIPGAELQDRRGRRDLMRGSHVFMGYLKERGGAPRGPRPGRLAPFGRHRHDGRGRLPADHRPQEGPPHHAGGENIAPPGLGGPPQAAPGGGARGGGGGPAQVRGRAGDARSHARAGQGFPRGQPGPRPGGAAACRSSAATWRPPSSA